MSISGNNSKGLYYILFICPPKNTASAHIVHETSLLHTSIID